MPQTPVEWLLHLDARLEARRPLIEKRRRYYKGDHPLAFATSRYRQQFVDMLGGFSDNWCDLVVDASVERLSVQGFRFGGANADVDDEAWSVWQRNGLDGFSVIAHTEAVKCGAAYLLVGPNQQITVEHPLQVITERDEENPQLVVAGLKKWRAADGRTLATVYLPEGIYKYERRPDLDQMRVVLPSTVDGNGWEPRRGVEYAIPNPFRAVPMIPLENNPDLLDGGLSDIDRVMGLQDGLNTQWHHMLVTSEFQSFRQRIVTGVEVPDDQQAAELKASASRVWFFEPGAQVTELGQADLSQYAKTIEMTVQHIAAQTRTPPHYLLGQSGSFPSGESLKATETGLVAKVRRKQSDFKSGWVEAMRLALGRGSEELGDVVWKDPESRSEGEMVDALLKLRTLGVPLEVLWERYGFSPQQIDRMKTLVGLPQRAALADSTPASGGE